MADSVDITLDLAHAMVTSSSAPLLLLDGAGAVLAASTTFSTAFNVPAETVGGRSLFDLGGGEWNTPQLRNLLEITAAGDEVDAYEMDLPSGKGAPRKLVLNLRRMAYGPNAPVRLLLTVADVTEARLAAKLKDDLLREKAILLQEVQHRVANSLQIIASVILQSARKVQSEETKAYLHDAHNRVMSVATVQQHLAASQLGEVELRTYFQKLCDSLGASMIRDHNQLSIEVAADDSSVAADVSVSLGLIVTELVINALKHAFPGKRHGRIVVGYETTGLDWSLTVSDDGVGMPEGAARSKSGLGTKIVEALAEQLEAEVRVTPGSPGTRIEVVHDDNAPRDEAQRA